MACILLIFKRIPTPHGFEYFSLVFSIYVIYCARTLTFIHVLSLIKMMVSFEPSRRWSAPGLYLTFPNPILLEHGNERRLEAEILRADPLAAYLNWITIGFKFESRRLRVRLHKHHVASPVAVIALVRIPGRSLYSIHWMRERGIVLFSEKLPYPDLNGININSASMMIYISLFDIIYRIYFLCWKFV